jgi:hypothetical protein
VCKQASSAIKSNENGVMCIDRLGCCHNDKRSSVRREPLSGMLSPPSRIGMLEAFNLCTLEDPGEAATTVVTCVLACIVYGSVHPWSILNSRT